MQPPAPPGPAAEATPLQLATVDAVIARLQDEKGALLPILHAIQADLGFVPPAALPRIAEALNLTRAEVHGVVTYYHDFRTTPPGRAVLKVCRAEACQSMGCERLERRLRDVHGIGIGETSSDGSLTVAAVYCLGNCALSPAVQLDGRLHGRVTEQRLDQLLQAAGAGKGRA
jgi:formate dehydrogenase subunit gamma